MSEAVVLRTGAMRRRVRRGGERDRRRLRDDIVSDIAELWISGEDVASSCG